jgi:hypothetical protein
LDQVSICSLVVGHCGIFILNFTMWCWFFYWKWQGLDHIHLENALLLCYWLTFSNLMLILSLRVGQAARNEVCHRTASRGTISVGRRWRVSPSYPEDRVIALISRSMCQTLVCFSKRHDARLSIILYDIHCAKDGKIIFYTQHFSEIKFPNFGWPRFGPGWILVFMLTLVLSNIQFCGQFQDFPYQVIVSLYKWLCKAYCENI